MSQDDDHKHTFKPEKGKTLTKRNKCGFQINVDSRIPQPLE